MAKEKKNRKKGIVDPRKAERAQKRKEATELKSKSDATVAEIEARASEGRKANEAAAAARRAQEQEDLSTTTMRMVNGQPVDTDTTTKLTEFPPSDENVKLGYAGRPIPQSERPQIKLDEQTVAEDAEQAAIVREDEERKARIEAGETLPPRTPLDVVKGIQERRAAAERERISKLNPVELTSSVGEGFEEVTPGTAVRRSAGRTPRRGTGLVDFATMTGGGREGAGLSTPQQDRAARRAAERAENATEAGMDVERRSAAESVFGGAVEGQSAGQRLYTDPPEILDLARRLKTKDLMAEGKEYTPEELDAAVSSGLQGGHHQRLARIIHHTGLSAEELQGYAGSGSVGIDKINELHETVMRNVRSRRKNDVLPRMGLSRGEDGSITATPQAESELWQHPTEKDANGLPKTYKVSDLHPDMLRELNHPWGGVQSENEFEGTSVLRETPAISGTAKKNPAMRYAVANAKSAGDYLPVSIRFGHSKNAAGSWSFTPPPTGFEEGKLTDPQGFTSNVTHIADAIREGRTRAKGTRKSHAAIANELVASLDPNKQRAYGQRQVAVPMPGFSQGVHNTTGYEHMVFDVPHAGDDSITTYDDLPHVKDEHGNLAPLAPRSGRAGTGRSIHVRQTGPGSLITSPAEESAKTLMDTPSSPVFPFDYEEKRKDAAEAFGGEVSSPVGEAVAEGNRSSVIRSSLRSPGRAKGRQFMGPSAIPAQYRYKQPTLPGFEHIGNTEHISGTPEINEPLKLLGESVEYRNVETSPGVTESLRVPGPGRAVYTGGRIPATEPETRHTGISDARTLRLKAEAESGLPTIGGNAPDYSEPPKAPDYHQLELDFNPRTPGVVRTREFMGGMIRPLTEAERGVENVGANTIRGMNPPRKNFDVGAPTATAAPSSVETPISSGEIQLSGRGGKRRPLASGEKVVGTDVVVNATNKGVKGKKTRPLKRPPNSAALAE